MAKTSYYFCARPGAFNRDCQIIQIGPADSLTQTALRWAQTNGYDNVYVYDMNHQPVTKYERIM